MKKIKQIKLPIISIIALAVLTACNSGGGSSNPSYLGEQIDDTPNAPIVAVDSATQTDSSSQISFGAQTDTLAELGTQTFAASPDQGVPPIPPSNPSSVNSGVSLLPPPNLATALAGNHNQTVINGGTPVLPPLPTGGLPPPPPPPLSGVASVSLAPPPQMPATENNAPSSGFGAVLAQISSLSANNRGLNHTETRVAGNQGGSLAQAAAAAALGGLRIIPTLEQLASDNILASAEWSHVMKTFPLRNGAVRANYLQNILSKTDNNIAPLGFYIDVDGVELPEGFNVNQVYVSAMNMKKISSAHNMEMQSVYINRNPNNRDEYPEMNLFKQYVATFMPQGKEKSADFDGLIGNKFAKYVYVYDQFVTLDGSPRCSNLPGMNRHPTLIEVVNDQYCSLATVKDRLRAIPGVVVVEAYKISQ